MVRLKMADRSIYYRLGSNFRTPKEVEYLIRYITRTKDGDNKPDLCCVYQVGFPWCFNEEDIINAICIMQNNLRGTKDIGPRVFHEILWFEDEEMNRISGYGKGAREYLVSCCAQVYYNMGYQVVAALHRPSSGKWHIHFAINTVNFLTGNKFHTNLKEEQREREEYMNQCFQSIYYQ